MKAALEMPTLQDTPEFHKNVTLIHSSTLQTWTFDSNPLFLQCAQQEKPPLPVEPDSKQQLAQMQNDLQENGLRMSFTRRDQIQFKPNDDKSPTRDDYYESFQTSQKSKNGAVNGIEGRNKLIQYSGNPQDRIQDNIVIDRYENYIKLHILSRR